MRPRPPKPLRSTLRRLRVLLGTAFASIVAGCQVSVPSASANLNTAQAVLDLGEGLTSIREENAMLQAQIDSLRVVVAYQDTVLRQLALVSGVGMRQQTLAPPQ